jgi:hypothetical protein
VSPRLRAQLAEVAWRDSVVATGDPHAYPAPAPPTAEQVREGRRLYAVAQVLRYELRAAGFVDLSGDAIWGACDVVWPPG